jgi:hypothetical protein
MPFGSDTEFFYAMASGSIAASGGAAQVTGRNPSRKAFSIVVDSPDPVFLNLEAPATSATFLMRIPSYQVYELPKPCPTGSIFIAFGSTSGSVKWMDIS